VAQGDIVKTLLKVLGDAQKFLKNDLEQVKMAQVILALMEN